MIVAAPLGLLGVVFTLWLTGTSLNIQSAMGVLMMVGISVSNSVLLVEFANRLRAGDRAAEGHGESDAPAAPLDAREAVVRAARVRVRPILMTTVATVVGLLPMALHLRPGDEMNLPLARAVIGGLVGSTVLTLFVVPVLYTVLKPRGGRPAAADGTPSA
jgi:multidrug efflux pump subunit AcrB